MKEKDFGISIGNIIKSNLQNIGIYMQVFHTLPRNLFIVAELIKQFSQTLVFSFLFPVDLF